VTRRRENLANWRVMQMLDRVRSEKGLSLRDVGTRIGYHNASRVGQYLRGQIVPGPEMVRRLAIAVEVSPIEALWLSEHYAEVFSYLDKLYRLGWSWMRDDRVNPDQDFGADFSWYHIHRSKELWQHVRLDEVPPALVTRYHRVAINNAAGVFCNVSLPKPTACAILLGIGLFPRRGDGLRSETRSFIETLSVLASEMLAPAERVKTPPGTSFRKPLSDAEKVLPWRFYGSMRLAIVAEYVHFWCESVCRAYTEYARLVLYEKGDFSERLSAGRVDAREYWHAGFPITTDLRLDSVRRNN
jgi:transcriptional regulator with XRE-family HTH domain